MMNVMAPSFQKKAKYMNEEIVNGRIGCVFAKEAAASGRISYKQVPHQQEVSTLIEAFRMYAEDKIRTTMVLLPDVEPRSFDEGQEQAIALYRDMLLAQRTLELGHFEEAIARNPCFDFDALARQFHRVSAPPDIFEAMLEDPAIRQALCETFTENRMLGLRVCEQHSQSFRKLFAFVLAPYYTPLRPNFRHPRFAPHFAVVVNDWDEVNTTIHSRRSDANRTAEWERAATGIAYIQGYHIPVHPMPLPPRTQKGKVA